jgi:type II secretory pathway component GspD/PulD (secretin)
VLAFSNAIAQKISLKLNNADIVQILKTISDQSNYNIAIGSGVSGQVTLYLDSVEVLDAVEIICELAGVAYFVEENTIKVISQSQYIERYGTQPFDKRRLRVFELENALPANLANELNKLKSPKGVIFSEPRSNKLYVLETPQILSIMEPIISNADIKHGSRVYDLEFVTPEALQLASRGILTSSAIITPDLTNNRLIVSDRNENLNNLDEFVVYYDKPSKLESASFKLQYGIGSEILPHIQAIVTPNIGSVILDAANNQLFVTDIPEKVSIISELISSLDIKTKEVFIEARIVQVTLTDRLKIGVNWKAFTDRIDELGPVNVTADFNILSPDEQGLRYTSGLLTEDNYELVLEALAEEGKTDLLSSPHITTVNNKEAKIHVGSSVPYITIDTREENGTIRTFEKVTIIEVGVKLLVTPKINDDGFVKMHIIPEVSSVTGFTDGIPIVDKTQAETEVLVKDGVTLIIGGLMKNETRKTIKKIPILGDIPLLGMLFSSTDNQYVKSEIIIFITPHIISGEATQERQSSK